jgi:uncharacterized protein YqeY
MSLIEQITADLKTAMLARDTFATMTLRGLKSAILYEEVAKGKRDEGLSDAEIEAVVAREVKKRDDAVTIYTGAGDTTRADKESKEKAILEAYLPKQLSDEELKILAEKIIAENGFDVTKTGQAIGAVKAAAGNSASGTQIAMVVKGLLS